MLASGGAGQPVPFGQPHPKTDIVRTEAGLHVTSVLRTVTDLTAVLSLPAAVCVLDAALHQHLVTRDQLDAAVTARRGTPGVKVLAAAVAVADARAESPHETLTRLLFMPVLPDLEPQVTLHDQQGRHVARFDLADRRRRLAVESDGVAGHAGPAMVLEDRRRDDRAEGLGWWTERIGWYDVRRRPEQTAARVLRRARILDARRGGVA